MLNHRDQQTLHDIERHLRRTDPGFVRAMETATTDTEARTTSTPGVSRPRAMRAATLLTALALTAAIFQGPQRPTDMEYLRYVREHRPQHWSVEPSPCVSPETAGLPGAAPRQSRR